MSSPLRILLFGDGAWAARSLRRLSEGGHQILGVVLRTQPSDDSLSSAATALGVPKLHPPKANSEDFLARVQACSPELNLSISYNQIIRKPLIDSARLGFINMHAGKLPRYRGRNVINWAILNGETEIGLSAHYVDEGVDTGDVFHQRTFPIGWTDGYGDVLNRIVEAFPEFVAEAVDLVANGKAQRQPQNLDGGTYFCGREDGDEWLDWSDTSFNLYNKIRGIGRPGPGARTNLADKAVIAWRAYYDPAWPKYLATPGQVVGRRKEGVLVKTGDCTLLLQEIQIPGKEPEIPSWKIGTRLGHCALRDWQRILERLSALEQGRNLPKSTME